MKLKADRYLHPEVLDWNNRILKSNWYIKILTKIYNRPINKLIFLLRLTNFVL